jgi:hypothetical protein
MRDDHPLQQYHVNIESTLYLVLRLSGGGGPSCRVYDDAPNIALSCATKVDRSALVISATTRPPETSALPTFKGQLSGGSILRIEGKKVASNPPIMSDQVKRAMEEARQQQLRDNTPTIPSASILTDKVSNRKTTPKETPLVEQPPQQIQTNTSSDFTKNLKNNSSRNLNTSSSKNLNNSSSKNLKNHTKPLDVDDAKSITLVETSKKEVPPLNPNAELAPQIPSQYQKKTTTATTKPPPPPLTNQRHQSTGLLEEAWEFDIAPKQASSSACCIIS